MVLEGYVRYKTEAEAQNAMLTLNESNMDGPNTGEYTYRAYSTWR